MLKNSLLALSLLIGLAHLASAATDVVPLNYRSATDLEPILQRLAGDQANIASYGNQLIISSDNPSKIAEIKRLISDLDTEPKQLLITIDRTGSGQTYEQDYAVKGRLELGNSHVEIGSGTQNHLSHNSRLTNLQGSQQFRTLEGSTVNITSGMQRPQTTEVYKDKYGRIIERRQNYSQEQGLRITANVQGQQVTLTVDGSYLSPHSSTDNVQTGSISTQLTGRLGQWFELGKLNAQQQYQGQAINEYQQKSDQSSIGIRIKVELTNQ